ncbi:hypothetical protein LX32DRAFT_440420 [Colletotrichum zoysiae]|uniref:Uncharacterized protein n=1 Tax=Colletotrichum zoysiae TaxID=1216348 RepID=A0AAD9M319_9PEZI|nr:hypothetical protein LX32DRAFT_440420 [Colletotrichum zoysiae]
MTTEGAVSDLYDAFFFSFFHKPGRFSTLGVPQAILPGKTSICVRHPPRLQRIVGDGDEVARTHARTHARTKACLLRSGKNAQKEHACPVHSIKRTQLSWSRRTNMGPWLVSDPRLSPAGPLWPMMGLMREENGDSFQPANRLTLDLLLDTHVEPTIASPSSTRFC